MAFAPLVAFHEMDNAVRLVVEVVVDAEHEASVVCNVELELVGLIEVGSIRDEDTDVKVFCEVGHIVATTVGLDPALALKDGGAGRIWDVCSVFAFGEKFGDDAADAVLERLVRERFVRELSDSHWGEKRMCLCC